MFKKIVSNLAFSPALVGQLGFYAKRLKKEELTRRLGLIFTALALVVQSLTVFTPPEAVNAASAADFIPGGISNKQDLLRHYDRNTGGLRDVLSSLGITRANVNGVKKTTVNEKGHFNWSRTSLYSHAQGQRAWNYGKGTVFYRPMTLTAGSQTSHAVLAGYSPVFGWFAIKMDCGNLVTKKPPSRPNPEVVCENIRIQNISATRKRIVVKASKKDGAKINGYKVTISHGGKTVTRNIDTNQLTGSVEYENADPGKYRVVGAVRSSLGLKQSGDCKTTFDINTKASCEELVINRVGSTNTFKVIGKSKASNGVDIKRYVYSIQNDKGRTIATKRFDNAQQRHSFEYTQNNPGKYKIILVVKTSIGDQKSGACRDSFTVEPPEVVRPVAICTNVEANIVNRTIVTLKGSSAVQNGAQIKSYEFVVRQGSSEVKRVTVNSSALEVTTDSFELSPNDYSVQLFIESSEGRITNDDNCVAAFNIVKEDVCPYNPALPPASPECQPCPENPDIWIKDERCSAEVVSSKTGVNLTQGSVDATSTTARASDKISYTLTVENKGLVSEEVVIKEELADVLEYATLIDNGGGSFDESTKTITWNAINLGPGEKQSKIIIVQLLDTIPAINTGVSNEDSFNCVITNTFGNTIESKVDCPLPKGVEEVVTELPKTGPGENMLFAGVVGTMVTYFWARSRQLGKEVKLVRKDFNMGTI